MPSKLKLQRVPLTKLPPGARAANFEEVIPGYTLEQAMAEAMRCLACAKPHCVDGCPAANNIPGFLTALRQGDVAGAATVLRETNSFPGICGRLCDHERQCEGRCPLGHKGDPLAIGALERFVADWAWAAGLPDGQTAPRNGHSVAIVGAGPAGMACAADLARAGCAVTLFEAQPFIGGVLGWGVPLFRLPQSVLDAEIERLRALGVEFRLNTRLGTDMTLDDLIARGYEAVFLGLGAPNAKPMKLPGAELEGVCDSVHFLALAKLSLLGKLPSGARAPAVNKVLVVGGGNTAMDVALTALRLGATEVTVLYRRGEAEMPASKEEVATAREEGVKFRFLAAPLRFLGDGRGRLRAIECQGIALGEPDASGRRRPVPQPGSEFLIEADTCVPALGFDTDLKTLTQSPDLTVSKDGLVVTSPKTGRTTRLRVWAGGDVVLGPDTVVRAMVQGRAAARDMLAYLEGVKTLARPERAECAPEAARTP